jgi:hypothetical protein
MHENHKPITIYEVFSSPPAMAGQAGAGGKHFAGNPVLGKALTVLFFLPITGAFGAYHRAARHYDRRRRRRIRKNSCFFPPSI